MRVITGSARGRRLREPDGMAIRPTTDMVKEALFNIIQYDVEGRRALDLFAGTGQLGIEALSRGAREVVFVDESRAAARLVRENLEHCGFSAPVEQADAVGYLEACGKFDLIFLDPPYDTGLLDAVLAKIPKVDILTEGGIIICESRREKSLPDLPAPYRRTLERSYGRVKLTVYQRGSVQ
jgi:16S rRNA (guanine966-N2)-methyltransferase